MLSRGGGELNARIGSLAEWQSRFPQSGGSLDEKNEQVAFGGQKHGMSKILKGIIHTTWET